jgi:hypothetical protein
MTVLGVNPGLQTAARLKPVDDILEVLEVLAGEFLLDILSLAVQPGFWNLPMQLSDLHGLY